MPKFKKGQSGNPGGRPKGFASRVRELVNPDDIIDFALTLMANGKAKDKDRLQAAVFLTERGWGKPLQTIEVDATPMSVSPEHLSPELQAKLRALAEEVKLERESRGNGKADGKAVVH